MLSLSPWASDDSGERAGWKERQRSQFLTGTEKTERYEMRLPTHLLRCLFAGVRRRGLQRRTPSGHSHQQSRRPPRRTGPPEGPRPVRATHSTPDALLRSCGSVGYALLAYRTAGRNAFFNGGSPDPFGACKNANAPGDQPEALCDFCHVARVQPVRWRSPDRSVHAPLQEG